MRLTTPVVARWRICYSRRYAFVIRPLLRTLCTAPHHIDTPACFAAPQRKAFSSYTSGDFLTK